LADAAADVDNSEEITNNEAAASHRLERIQGRGEAEKPAMEAAAKADKKAKCAAPVAKGAPAKAKGNQKASATKNAPHGQNRRHMRRKPSHSAKAISL
jgi:hypothetical protein